jgi:hypothetical protein
MKRRHPEDVALASRIVDALDDGEPMSPGFGMAQCPNCGTPRSVAVIAQEGGGGVRLVCAVGQCDQSTMYAAALEKLAARGVHLDWSGTRH